MISSLKDLAHRLKLSLKLLSVAFFTLLLVALATPFIMPWAKTLIAPTPELGEKMVKEILTSTYMIVGTLFFFIFLYLLKLLYKIEVFSTIFEKRLTTPLDLASAQLELHQQYSDLLKKRNKEILLYKEQIAHSLQLKQRELEEIASTRFKLYDHLLGLEQLQTKLVEKLGHKACHKGLPLSDHLQQLSESLLKLQVILLGTTVQIGLSNTDNLHEETKEIPYLINESFDLTSLVQEKLSQQENDEELQEILTIAEQIKEELRHSLTLLSQFKGQLEQLSQIEEEQMHSPWNLWEKNFSLHHEKMDLVFEQIVLKTTQIDDDLRELLSNPFTEKQQENPLTEIICENQRAILSLPQDQILAALTNLESTPHHPYV